MIPTKEPVRPLSDAIFGPLNKAYKAGGFGLSFLALGAVLVLVAYFSPRQTIESYVLLSVGIMLMASTWLLFFVKDVRPLFRAQRRVEENRALIDAVQRTAITLTELASDAQSLAFKHSQEISATITAARPYIGAIPVAAKLFGPDTFQRADALAAWVVANTNKAKKIIVEIERALTTSNPAALASYQADLELLCDDLRQALTEPLRPAT